MRTRLLLFHLLDCPLWAATSLLLGLAWLCAGVAHGIHWAGSGILALRWRLFARCLAGTPAVSERGRSTR